MTIKENDLRTMAGSKNEVLMAIINDPPIKVGELAQRYSCAALQGA